MWSEGKCKWGRVIGKEKRRNGLRLNTDRQISGLSHNNFREREEGKHKTKEQRWERECKIAQFNVQKKKTNKHKKILPSKT